jgi:hypothetical protein
MSKSEFTINLKTPQSGSPCPNAEIIEKRRYLLRRELAQMAHCNRNPCPLNVGDQRKSGLFLCST